MLLPTSVDVLHCIERTLQTVIAPGLTGAAERSAAATVGHMLRHVILRIEREGAMYTAEIAMVRPLLDQARDMFRDDFPDAAETQRVLSTVAAALSQPATTAEYRDVASLAAEVTSLRAGVCDALALIQGQDTHLSAPANDLYEALKRYVAWELDNEAQLIDPAFEGFGPRR